MADRLRLATGWVKEVLADLEVTERINTEVSESLEKGQREAILRRQLAAIRSELGEGDDDLIGEFRTKLDDLRALTDDPVPEATLSAIEREIDRLERTGSESMEANWIRTWLETVFELPWDNRSMERLDLTEARSILDADHTGLDDVKDRLVEHLAVRKLRARSASDDTPGHNDRRRGVILALVGPPGVGKTSLGESVARALGRSFVRLALGGIRDEAEIRGHRRTYVGARPGRLVRALSEAGSMNPVVLLDEIDKVTGGWNGDPSAALLEVLDPAQNHSFRDHYLEFELDLSDVLFIATANVLETIPGPLLDRMEIIPIDGYTESEKAAIAVEHLLPRLVSRNGLDEGEVSITPAAVDEIAANYTREAGVRRLERLLDKALRKAATRIATGEATSVTVDVDDLRDLLGRPIPAEEVADRIDRPGHRNRARRDWRRRRRAVRGDGPDGRRGRTGPHWPTRRRDEGVGHHCPIDREFPGRTPRGHPSPRPTASRALPRRRRAQGRSFGGRHHDHGAGEPALGSTGAAGCGHDRRGDVAGSGAPDRGREAEGAGRPPGRNHRRDPAHRERTRRGRHPRRGSGRPSPSIWPPTSTTCSPSRWLHDSDRTKVGTTSHLHWL